MVYGAGAALVPEMGWRRGGNDTLILAMVIWTCFLATHSFDLMCHWGMP